MRLRSFLRIAAISLCCAASAQAQFQAPTQEELKMTADPKAPGAAAVYLNFNVTADDGAHFVRVYSRAKVLTEKGKELATVGVLYLHKGRKVEEIKARTIHADGTIIPLEGKTEELLVVKKGDLSVEAKVFNLPSVEVGSILEYEYTIRYDDELFSAPIWEIQKPYFVHKSHYEFVPFKEFLPTVSTNQYLIDEHGHPVNQLLWWTRLPKGVTVKTGISGHYWVDLEDIPAAPKEEWMPPETNYLAKVMFYYKNEFTEGQFWTAEAKMWSKDVDHFAEASKPIHDAANGLVAPGDSETDKAKKLYVSVQGLENTDYSRKKGKEERKRLNLKEAKTAADIWQQKSGDSEEIALLYLALARAAGLNAHAMKLADRKEMTFDPSYMYAEQLEETVVALNIGGKEVLVDPGEKMCPFGTLHWRHSDASGFSQDADEHKLIATTPSQAYTDNRLTRVGDFAVDTQGGISGSLRFIMTGQEALKWRQKALENDESELKKQFDEWMEPMIPEGVEGKVDHFIGLDNPDTTLMAMVNVKGALGTATAKRVMLPGFFFEARGEHPFVGDEKRETAVDMHYGEVTADQITYHLPEGTTVEGAPQDGRIAWAGHEVLVTKIAPAAEQIVIARQLSRAFTFASASEYQDLRGFYQKVAASDQQQIVLTRAASEKGN